MSNENEILDAFMGIPAEKEYYITEWTSDRAITSWWKESNILKEHSISNYSKDKKEWHCSIKEERIYSNNYNNDWYLLMAVFRKIKSLPTLRNEEYHSTIQLTLYNEIIESIPDHQKTHIAIIKFIKWYAGIDPTIFS